MAGIFSARLGDGNVGGAGSGLAYTGPALVTTVIRCLTVVLFPGTTFGGLYRVASVAYIGGAVNPGAGLVIATIDMRQVINPGETVEWQFQGGGGTWMFSGYQLT